MLVSLLKIIVIILQLIFFIVYIYIHHVHVSHHHHTERNSVITVAVGFFCVCMSCYRKIMLDYNVT